MTDVPTPATSGEDYFGSAWHYNSHELLAIRGAKVDPFEVDTAASVTVAATANITTYASLPTPATLNVTLANDWRCLFLFSLHIDLAVNNADVAAALDFSGAATIAAGSRPQDRLHVVAKSPISATFSLARVAVVPGGTTRVELMHAGDGFTMTDGSLEVVPLVSLATWP
jgi:hypothetical protein